MDFVVIGILFGGIILSILGFYSENGNIAISGILISLGVVIYMCFGYPSRDYPNGNYIAKIIGYSVSIVGILILVIHRLPTKIMIFIGIAVLIGGCFFISSELIKSSKRPAGDGINSCENCGREGVSLEPETGFCYDCYQGFTEWRIKEATKEYQDHGEWWK